MRSVLGRPTRVLGVGITWKMLEDYWVGKRLSTGVLRGRAEDGGRRAEESQGGAKTDGGRRAEGGGGSADESPWTRGVRGSGVGMAA